MKPPLLVRTAIPQDVLNAGIEWEDLSPAEQARLKRLEERNAAKLAAGLPVRKGKQQLSRVVGKGY
jgi:hypothetical protein